ncbi:MAG: hypothetical protein GY820_16920 [Gammaproteobacteria bacterium]|nr:hypothetical protein [Gammaproteobacteria bacterium]
MTTKLWLDFETYSEVDLKLSGLYKYTAHSSFHPWCAAYAFDDGPVHLWKPWWKRITGVLFDAILDPSVKIYAHNAEFEWRVIENTPQLPDNIPLDKFVDCMALAATFGFPLKLDKFVKAIGLPYGKTAGATRLINKLCIPQKKSAFNPTGKWTPETQPEDFKKLYEYCVNDVEIMRRAVKRLPMEELLPMEQYIWQHVAMQNWRGMPIDIESVMNIIHVLAQNKVKQEHRLQTATGGSVQTGKQTAKLKEWLNENGCSVPNLKKETVDKWLDRETSSLVHDVLLLRKELALSSTAKFDRIAGGWQEDGRVRGNAVYFGAHTGRNAGRGIQIHNLPRAKHDNPQSVINAFQTRRVEMIRDNYGDVTDAAKKLIRPMIKASPGHKLFVVDYSSIENVVLHWAADDKKTTQEFKDGLDQYITYSADRLGIAYENVTKKQRGESKPDVLGLGYGGGVGALMYTAANYGIELDKKEAQRRVNFYRNKYSKVCDLWSDVFVKAYQAVATGDPQFYINDSLQLEFRSAGGYLFILLPSGRRLSYPGVRINAEWTIIVNNKPITMSSKLSYMGVKNNTFLRVGTHPGLLVENIIQAMARDILVYGLLCAEQAGYTIIGSVHDEGIAEVADSSHMDLDTFVVMMCTLQPWAKTIPVRAEGYVAQRYRKD